MICGIWLRQAPGLQPLAGAQESAQDQKQDQTAPRRVAYVTGGWLRLRDPEFERKVNP